MKAVLLVTRTGTITVFAYQFVATTRCFVLVRTIISRMTASAVWLISGELPVYEIGIGQVTFGTLQISTMVERLIRQSRMCINVREPCRRIVTNVALLSRYEMPVIFSGRKCPVMTGRTRSQHLRMINPSRWHPHRDSVAIFTNVGG